MGDIEEPQIDVNDAASRVGHIREVTNQTDFIESKKKGILQQFNKERHYSALGDLILSISPILVLLVMMTLFNYCKLSDFVYRADISSISLVLFGQSIIIYNRYLKNEKDVNHERHMTFSLKLVYLIAGLILSCMFFIMSFLDELHVDGFMQRNWISFIQYIILLWAGYTYVLIRLGSSFRSHLKAYWKFTIWYSCIGFIFYFVIRFGGKMINRLTELIITTLENLWLWLIVLPIW